MPTNHNPSQFAKTPAPPCLPIRLAVLLLIINCVGPLGVLSASPWQPPIKDLKTVAESSNFTATSNYADVLSFVDQCSTADHVTRFDFGKSVEGRAMVGTLIANPPFVMETARSSQQPDPRLRILLLGNIHSGECAGKEALLAMLRELALDPNHPWLADCVILIAPNYNVDANERVGLNQRPGQVGPSKGMGQRENAMQLDLNRDFVKLESPEARSLVKLIDEFNPHLFIDCHTTNGSRHQYLLTYDIPHNPTAPKEIRDYLRNNMMPQVTQKLEDKDILTFYYGNFSRDNSRWSTYGHEPRYSTEYVGLRGRLGILSEAYSYATYADRIKGTDAFVKECIEHVRDHADDVKNLLELPNPKPEELIHLDSQMAAFPEKYVIRGYEGEQKKDYEVTFFGDYRPTTTVTMPDAYAFPTEMSFLAERLQMHGIQVEQLTDQASNEPPLKGRAYQISAIDRSPRSFQKHNMVKLEVAAELEDVNIPANSFIVSTRQPLGRLVSYVLEPETNEGFVTWNFLDPWLSVGGSFPIYRIETNQYTSHPVNEIQPGRQLKLKDIFGPDKLPLGDLSLGQVQWLSDGTSYSVEKNGRRLSMDAASGSENRLPLPFDVADVAEAMKSIGGPDRAQISQLLSEGIALRGPNQKLFLLKHDGKTFVYDSAKQKAIRLGTAEAIAELADLNPAGNQVAFVQANNLLLLKDVDAVPTQVTSDGMATLLNGKLDWVYQEELYGRGNFKAFWWAPNGSALAFLKIDEAPVHPFTVTDHIPVRSRLEVTAYPKAGDPLPTVDVGIYNLAENSTCWAKLPQVSAEPLNELLISRVTWEPDSASLLVQIQNRIQSWLDLCRVQADTGDLSVVFRDQTPAWITSPGDPLFLSDCSFLWLSPRSGYNAIYRHAKTG
ncbi:MAG: DPP IV N-terminal domain-containing protein, partial [Pirellulaceae bacterium]|nr:DPP IV N-terminal domain-containing protein [Pirellulaceae bacterium]